MIIEDEHELDVPIDVGRETPPANIEIAEDEKYPISKFSCLI